MTDSVGEKASRLLDEAAQLCDLLRMAHATAHRMQQDIYGQSYDHVTEMSNRLHDLRVECNRLFDEVKLNAEQLVENSGDIASDGQQ